MSLCYDLPRVTLWVANKAEADPRCSVAAVGWERDGELTAGVFFEIYTGKAITATIAVEEGALFPKELLLEMFKYPLIDLGCWKIIALVAESNYKSQRLVERLGFSKEAVVADYYSDGDLFIYSITRDKCRYLEKQNGQEN